MAMAHDTAGSSSQAAKRQHAQQRIVAAALQHASQSARRAAAALSARASHRSRIAQQQRARSRATAAAAAPPRPSSRPTAYTHSMVTTVVFIVLNAWAHTNTTLTEHRKLQAGCGNVFTRVSQVNTACCPSGGGHRRRRTETCTPTACSATCATVLVPFLNDCGATLQAAGQDLSQLYSLCSSCRQANPSAQCTGAPPPPPPPPPYVPTGTLSFHRIDGFMISGSGSHNFDGYYSPTSDMCGGHPIYVRSHPFHVKLYKPDGSNCEWTVVSNSGSDCGNYADIATGANHNCHDSPAGSECVGLWQDNTNHWATVPNFKVSSNIDQATAEALCQNSGSHLASIHSDADDQLAQSLVHGQCHNSDNFWSAENSVWIGLHRIAPHSSAWAWTDGSSTSFTAWKVGEPNDMDGGNGEEYAVYHGSTGFVAGYDPVDGWIDVNNNGGCGILCRHQGAPSPPPPPPIPKRYSTPRCGYCRGPGGENDYIQAKRANSILPRSACQQACDAEPACVGYDWSDRGQCDVYGRGMPQRASATHPGRWVAYNDHATSTTIAGSNGDGRNGNGSPPCYLDTLCFAVA
jgi:hypothetical protein